MRRVKTRQTFALAALLASVALPAFGRTPVVKIKSRWCESNGPAYQGSGTLFSREGKLFAITSAHVVLHGNQDSGACHEIKTADGVRLEMSLRAVDFARGLALLESRLDASSALLSTTGPLTVAPESSLGESATARMVGYPFASETPIVDAMARVLNPRSTRSVLPSVSELIEIKGHNEFGMSGGGAFDADGRFVGVISHQYLRRVEGKPATISDNDGTSDHGGELIGLVLPGESVSAWIDRAIDSPASVWMAEDIAGQKAREASMTFDGIRFRAVDCVRKEVTVGPKGIGIGGPGGDGVGVGGPGGDGVGIGGPGGDGVGIGGPGGDGVGIGGSPSGACRVELSLAGSTFGNRWTFAPAGWLSDARRFLTLGAQVSIVGLSRDLRRYPINHLYDVLTGHVQGYVPMFITSGLPWDDTNETEARLSRHAKSLRTITVALRDAQCVTSRTQPLFTATDVIGDAIDARQFALITNSALDELMRSDDDATYAQMWDTLYQCDLVNGAALKGTIKKIRTDIEKVLR